MRRSLTFIVVAWLAGAGAAVAQGGGAPAKAKATTPEIPFESVPNFFKKPAGIYTGENMGIATNSKGNIYIYHRAGETRLFEFAAGHVRQEIGATTTASRSRTRCASTRRTTSGRSTRAPT